MLATADLDLNLRLWDVRSRRPIGQPFHFPGETIDSVAFSPDAKVLATGSYDDAEIRLWDVATRLPLGALLAGEAGGGTVAFNPAGTALATADGGETATIWPATLWSDDGPALERRICTAIAHDLSGPQWRADFPGQPFRTICHHS
jgi:hypothetical protein